jgi:V/A-type H+-transporting ATPase subunit E
MESGKAGKLRNKIVSDAEDEARKIVEEGEAEARSVKEEAGARIRKINADFAAKAKSQAEEYISRQISLRELEARKAVLAEKGALIDEVFNKALEELRNRDRKGGYALTHKLLIDAIEAGDEEIVLSPEDKQAIGAAFVETLNGELRKAGKRGEVKIAEETREIRGGFILKRGRTETNASFDTLLAMLRDDIETEVANILLSGGGGAG